MKIVVNYIAASPGGGLNILLSFYKYIIEYNRNKEHQWIFLLNNNYLEPVENINVITLEKIKKSWIRRLIFDLFTGRKIIRKINPDIVISMQNTIIFGIKCPQFNYMHQSIPFQKIKKFSFFKKHERKLAVYQYFIGSLIKLSIKKASLTIVQSQWVKDSIIKTLKISNDKILKIFPNIIDYTLNKKEGLFNNKYFFYPAANYVYKNHKCIYEAINILNADGIVDFSITLTIDNKSNSVSPNLSFVGEMHLNEVIDFYNYSTLIFPSLIETIGLPLLEAKQLGAIILASDTPFSREVLAGYNNAYFFNPYKPEELASLMKLILEGKIKKNEYLLNNKVTEKNSWEILYNKMLEYKNI